MHGDPPSHVPAGVPFPAPHTTAIRVLYPRPGYPLRVLVLSQKALTVPCHWGDNRTTPHVEPPTMCDSCVLAYPLRVNAYVACYCPNLGRFVLAEITSTAVRSCPALDPGSGRDLRGLWLTMERAGNYKQSPVRAELSDLPIDPARVPPEFPVALALEKMWGLRPGTIRAT